MIYFLATVGLIFWLSWKVIQGNNQIAHIKKQIKCGLSEDLELATSEQLLNELRRRPSCPYILVMPIKTENREGLKIEIHNVPPPLTLSVLRMATVVTAKELRKRGLDIIDNQDSFSLPNFPPEMFNDN